MAKGSELGTEIPQSKLISVRRRITRVRTGCITCKKRRVKCDEQKPVCMRCTRYGQHCDGYEADRLAQNPRPAAPKGKPILLPAVKVIPDLRSNNEQRSFDFFRSITGPKFSSDYDSGFWVATVLQFSHMIPSYNSKY
ncbi:unnamed protein product [Clonostachys rosea f. rosea IK726]|uniref:Uncharacterized protein n=1 Tax=Clonostachys rosea f. rosea IK726 TaxID=1349383 RepID=A0ACA9UDP1_BIOOC|nr:unnamed protein product [Clonostachys rosea f. rosea IK726]